MRRQEVTAQDWLKLVGAGLLVMVIIPFAAYVFLVGLDETTGIDVPGILNVCDDYSDLDERADCYDQYQEAQDPR